ncbi:UNVERIFIED_CONTAM: hypothetical protein GTU68_041400, partial [Idotea baltica]|nr:hypothetical protein [Idotea baltica]
LILTFKLASVTTILLLFVGIPVAYWLSETKSRVKHIVEALVTMPLVLPPTVIGFYLLIVFSPSNAVGNWLGTFGLQFVFTFEGLVLASIIYSLPFMVQPIQSGLSNLPSTLSEASYVLGKSRIKTLFSVLLPNIKPSILAAIVLSFAHTIGEFGVVLMIGGNIPGKTKVASIAIYDEVETLNYGMANAYSLILFAITFSILILVYFLNGKNQNREMT